MKPYVNILYEETRPIQKAVIHKRNELRDLSTPKEETMVEILDTIDMVLLEKRNIYMHCFGGKGRTWMVVDCYLVRRGMPGKQALEMIQELRRNIYIDNPGDSPETEGQRRMVLEWTKGR